MATLCAKSSCCGARVHRFGARRRRCSACWRTWSVHRARRGRKRLVVDADLPRQLLVEYVPTRVLARRQHRSESTVRRRCRAAIDRIIDRSAEPAIPDIGDFVMLVDGLRHRIKGEGWVQYTVALKPTADSVAYFMDPIFIPGPESAPNWRTVFDMLTPAVALRIRGPVSDGLRGMKELAASKGWVYQRCHYHLWALLRPWLWIMRRQGDGAIIDAVSVGLTAPERELAEAARVCLRAYVTANPGGVSGVLNQLLRDWAAARCHIDHSDLQIPTTTNVVESMHRLMRDSLSGTSTLDGIMRRATALTRLHPPLTCNDHTFQQNQRLHPPRSIQTAAAPALTTSPSPLATGPLEHFSFFPLTPKSPSVSSPIVDTEQADTSRQSTAALTELPKTVTVPDNLLWAVLRSV